MKTHPLFVLTVGSVLVLGGPTVASCQYPVEVLADLPLAYWRLGEAAGPTVADASGNGHDGTADAGVLFAEPGLLPAEADGAVRTTGGPRVVVAGFEKNGPGATGYTVEAWFTLESAPTGYHNLVGDGEGGGDYYLMLYLTGDRRLRAHFSPAGTPVSIDSTRQLSAGETVHVVATWDRTRTTDNAAIYVDGELDRQATVSTALPANSDNAVYLGRDDREPGGDFTLDEVAVYDHPLSGARIRSHFEAGVPATYRDRALFDRPLAYWRLGEASGPAVADATGNGHDGTADAGVLFAEPGLQPADSDTAVRVTGSPRIVVPAFEKHGAGAAGYSVEAWLTLESAPTGYHNLVGDGEGAGDFYLMLYLTGDRRLRAHFSPTGSPVSIDSDRQLLVGETVHVVATWDRTRSADNAAIYFDGALDRQATVSTGLPANSDNAVYLGRDDREPGGDFTLDEVAIYDHPLSPDKVAAHFEAGVPATYRDRILFDRPLAYWRLGEAAGPVAVDATGNGHDGTADAGVLFAEPGLLPADPDTAVRTTGGPRIVVPAFEKHGAGATGYAVEAWFTLESSPTGYHNLVGDGEGAGDFYLMLYLTGDRRIRAHFSPSGAPVSIDSNRQLGVGETVHVVATWDRTRATDNGAIYIDASLDRLATVSTAAPTHGDNAVYVGRDDREPGGDFTLDEVALYDHPLSSAKVASHFGADGYAARVLADRPLAYWRLGEAAGPTVVDATGNGHSGTADAGVEFGEPGLLPGETDTAVRTTGSSRITVSGFEKHGAGASGYTVELWMTLEASPTGYHNLVGDGESAGDFFLMLYLTGDRRIRAHFSPAGAPVSIDSNRQLQVGDMVYVVATWDRSLGTDNAAIYIDAYRDRLATVSTAAPTNTDNAVYLGRDDREPGGDFILDEVAVYDYPLSEEQIRDHFGLAEVPVTLQSFGVD